MNTVKIWFARITRSRTMWFNAIIAALSALEGVFGLLQPYVPGNIFAYVTVILTVGNAILRTVTTQPLSEK